MTADLPADAAVGAALGAAVGAVAGAVVGWTGAAVGGCGVGAAAGAHAASARIAAANNATGTKRETFMGILPSFDFLEQTSANLKQSNLKIQYGSPPLFRLKFHLHYER
jgi:hypothetical protein